MTKQGLMIVMLAPAVLCDDPKNPRKVKDDEALRDLALDVKRRGVLVPLLVRKNGDVYVLIDGHRRRAAALIAGVEQLPCVVFGPEVTEAEIREAQLTTSLHSEALTPHQIYVGIKNWLALHPTATAKDVAAAISRSEGYVSMVLSLDKCVQPAKDLAAAGKLLLKQWYKLSKLPPDKQLEQINGTAGGGEEETIKVSKIKCEVPGKKASVVVSGKDISLTAAIKIVEEWLREAKKAAEQGLSASSFERVCRDRSKAG